MGEHRRREAKQTPHEKRLADLSRRLTDEGKLIEAGWLGLRAMWLHPDAPADQVKEMRMAFMAGAQHLFSSIMTVMDEDREPTAADLGRMDMIAKELDAFGREMVDGLPVEGRA